MEYPSKFVAFRDNNNNNVDIREKIAFELISRRNNEVRSNNNKNHCRKERGECHCLKDRLLMTINLLLHIYIETWKN